MIFSRSRTDHISVSWMKYQGNINAQRQFLVAYTRINKIILSTLEDWIFQGKPTPADIEIPLQKIIEEECNFSEENIGWHLTGIFDSIAKVVSDAGWSYTIDSGEKLVLHYDGLGYRL